MFIVAEIIWNNSRTSLAAEIISFHMCNHGIRIAHIKNYTRKDLDGTEYL